MNVQTPRPPRSGKSGSGGPDFGKALSSRGGLITIAVVAALFAAALLAFYLHQYRSSVDDSGKVTTVLVAKGQIDKGASGDVVASTAQFQATTVKKGQLKDGAISDPRDLRGKTATTSIYPGEQLVASDFTIAKSGVINQLGPDQRAISVPLDSAHGMIGQVRAGDHVDVLAGFNTVGVGAGSPVLRVLIQNALVLQQPDTSKNNGVAGGNSQNVVLRVSSNDASKLAFTSDNGKVWLVLRPGAGAKAASLNPVTLDALLAGIKPIKVHSHVTVTGNGNSADITATVGRGR